MFRAKSKCCRPQMGARPLASFPLLVTSNWTPPLFGPPLGSGAPDRVAELSEGAAHDSELERVLAGGSEPWSSSACAAEAEQTPSEVSVINQMGETVTHPSKMACVAGKSLHKRGEESPWVLAEAQPGSVTLGQRGLTHEAFPSHRSGQGRPCPSGSTSPAINHSVLQVTPRRPGRPSRESVTGLSHSLRGG